MIMTDVILFLNSANGQLLLHVCYTGVGIVKKSRHSSRISIQ